jgi:hypothetical protein
MSLGSDGCFSVEAEAAGTGLRISERVLGGRCDEDEEEGGLMLVMVAVSMMPTSGSGYPI